VYKGEYGRAVRSTRGFQQGETVGWLWGKLLSPAAMALLESTPHRDPMLRRDPTHVEGQENYSTPAQHGIWRTVSTGSGGLVLLVSEQCPMAYVNHGDIEAQRNVSSRIAHTDFSQATAQACRPPSTGWCFRCWLMSPSPRDSSCWQTTAGRRRSGRG